MPCDLAKYPVSLSGLMLIWCLQEFPSIRFRAGKPSEDAAVAGLDVRTLMAQRLAVEVNERLQPLQRSGQLPDTETCDLLIVDRYVD